MSKRTLKILSIIFILSFALTGIMFASEKPVKSATENGAQAVNTSYALQILLWAVIFGLAGIILLIIGYYLWELVTVSYSVKKQLIERQNVAVGIVVAGFIIGMAIIIGATLISIM